ncbi:MAG: Electron transfer flavoprotein alpha/beta-subunit [Vampirovibrio sp.]|jgi:electron transfer flavoprotein beta subunit|nr:Electron transfer flavoprotein alpha/beta-subunit [Vampirovibrio sp.]
MKIVVFIKQVLDNTKLKFSDGKPVMEGVPMMMNPFDEYALETALKIKEQAGGDSTVTVFSLGTPNAKDIIKKAIAAGADDAFLLSDAAFNDGDSTANAYALANAVKTLVPDYKVLVFGQMALDDAAGQTGPKVAEILGLPSLTYGKNVALNGETLKIYRESERGTEEYDMQLPGVICMMKCDYELRSSNIKGVMKANKTEIPIKTPADIGLEPALAGVAGSATKVVKTWQRPAKVGGKVVEGSDAKAAVGQLLDYLREAKVL